ncbi:MAG: NADP(H)-dependent aldo-keto reductase [Rickettsiales bacterium]|nr:NADP(H)-dependent aldo-keto reductase [Rickettsiales bacterium]
METKKLGNTNIDVSTLCLGTMTWGQQNTQDEGFEQMDYALERGVNFFDTAELYAVPPMAETQGSTEAIIGNWFESRKNRDQVILASKVTGRSGMEWFRGEESRLSRKHILEAAEGSLKRLKTDYIDLYQLHWPDRSTNFFGQLGYNHKLEDDAIALEESLSALEELVKAGKVRHIGLSNETPWGINECLRLAREKGLPRVMSVQNPYSLLNRSYEVGCAEISIREQCGLLAYSPLAFGMLTGKYNGGAKPAKGRLTVFDQFQRYLGERSVAAAEAYSAIAAKHGLSPAQMALAYVNTRPFLTSNIVGATTMEQLKENIDSIDVKLSDEILAEIEAVHNQNPNPAP